MNKLLLTITAVASIATSMAAEKPNILFIFADDLGYGDLGYTGSTQIKTPNVDQLAKQGVVFDRAYVTAPFCGPSRAAVLTGRYQQRFGFEWNPRWAPNLKPEKVGMPTSEKMFGKHMQEAGYVTGAIGKWHMGYHNNFYPTNRGFDYFFGMRGGGHSYFPSVTEKRPGWYPDFSLERMGTMLKKVEEPYLTDWFTTDAFNFIKREKENDKPWMLYLSYNCPHGPLEAKKEDIAKYKHIKHKGRRTYCAMVDNFDQNVGRLIKQLKATGQYENTAIFFLNDNGGSIETVYAVNAPFWGTKGTFFEGGVRVPMFIHYPAKLKPQRYKHSVSAMDILPTSLGLAKHEGEMKPFKNGNKVIPRTFDGVDLMPYLTGKKESLPHEKLFWRVMFRGSASVDGDWKCITTPHDLPQLYNLADDPSERNDLAAKNPERVQKMMNAHFEWAMTFESHPLWVTIPYWLENNRDIHRKVFNNKQP